MKTFDNQKTIEKELTAWLNNSPESNHHYDYERWFNCIYKSFLTNTNIDFEEIKEYLETNTKWNTTYIKEFISKKEGEYSLIVNMLNHLKENNLSVIDLH